MRREGIAALGDERAIGFGMGYPEYSLSARICAWFWCLSHPVACPLAIRGAGTSARRQAFDRRRAMGLPRKAAQAINVVAPALLPSA